MTHYTTFDLRPRGRGKVVSITYCRGGHRYCVVFSLRLFKNDLLNAMQEELGFKSFDDFWNKQAATFAVSTACDRWLASDLRFSESDADNFKLATVDHFRTDD